MDGYLETGEIVSCHGIRGEVKVYPWADSPDFLLRFRELKIGEALYSVERSRVQGTCVLLKLRGIDSIEAASPLIHKTVYFAKAGVKPDKGYFIADLIGLRVFSEEKEIGRIEDVLQYPGNDVLLVRGEKEYLVPFVPAFVHKVDLEQGRADISLLEGMASDEN